MGDRGRMRPLASVLAAVAVLVAVGAAVVLLGTQGPVADDAPAPSGAHDDLAERVRFEAPPPPGVSVNAFRATFVAFRGDVPLLDPGRWSVGDPASAFLRVEDRSSPTTVHVLANGFVAGPRRADAIRSGTASGITLDDWRPATILRVLALDRDGKPAAGATVRVARPSPGGDAVEPAQYLSSRTDATGRRDVTVFPGEACRISGSHRDASGSATPVLLDASQTVPGGVVDVTLRFP